MAIDISTLTEADKGREVRYTDDHDMVEWGRIVRWDHEYIWVLYHTRQYRKGEKTERLGKTAEATHPRNLEFCS